MVVKVFCDNCGKEILADEWYATVVCYEKDTEIEYTRLHLCEKCFDELYDKIKRLHLKHGGC